MKILNKIILCICTVLTIGCQRSIDKKLLGYWEIDAEYIIDNNDFIRGKEYKIMTLINFRENGTCTTYSNLDDNNEFKNKYASSFNEVYFTENNCLWILSKEEYDAVGLRYKAHDIYEIKKDVLFTWDPEGKRLKMKFVKITKHEFFKKMNPILIKH